MMLAVLTSIFSGAPLPGTLPNYDVECRAGSMTSAEVFRVDVSVQKVDGERRGTVRTPEGTFPADIETRAIALNDSIGGTGFIDLVEFEVGGRSTVLLVGVRGSISNNLIRFGILSRENDQGVRESTRFEGQCQLASNETSNGAVQ